MRTLALALLLGGLSVSGCVSSSSSKPTGARSDRYRITREELQAMPPGTAMDVVERLHRDWLRGRSATVTTSTGRNYPHVFVDGRPFGPTDTLLSFETNSIEEIRFITPSDATTRYGTGYPGGIIEIILRRNAPK